MKPERLREIQDAWYIGELTDRHVRELVTAIQWLHIILESELKTYPPDMKNETEYERSEYYRNLGAYALAERIARSTSFK